MVQEQEWVLCPGPRVNNTLRWNEPIWASPNKPRGKPDKIGEQQIVALLTATEGFLQFTVISVSALGDSEAPLSVKENDIIRRKRSTLKQGDCHKLLD
jgi:hypothetical protein